MDCHGQLNALYVCLLMGHRLSLTFADSWIMTVCEWVSLWLFHQLKLHSDRLMSACENGFNLVCSGFMIGLIVAFQWIMHIYCMYIYIYTHILLSIIYWLHCQAKRTRRQRKQLVAAWSHDGFHVASGFRSGGSCKVATRWFHYYMYDDSM